MRSTNSVIIVVLQMRDLGAEVTLFPRPLWLGNGKGGCLITWYIKL